MCRWLTSVAATVSLVVLGLGVPGGGAAAEPASEPRAAVAKYLDPQRGADESDPVKAGHSKPARSLPKVPQVARKTNSKDLERVRPDAESTAGAADTVVQTAAGVAAAEPITSPLFTPFAGQTSNFSPPDTVGDVGPNHYVQMINTHFQMYDRTGATRAGPSEISTLWTGGLDEQQCDSQNAGDPIVLYDQQADRWMLSQFTSPSASPFFMCIAYSQTSDPTGAYFTYEFELPASHDYMKYGIWPDGLYMSTWEGSSLGIYVFDRSPMLNGSPATFQRMTSLGGGGGRGLRVLPSDWDGANPPAAGEPNHFTLSRDVEVQGGGGNDRLEIYDFHVDWANPANSTLGLAESLDTAPFSIELNCTPGFRDCIPQPGTTQRLDDLANRLMHRLQYRNFGDHASMVVNQTVDAGDDRAGIRWYELRNSGAGWSIYQQGTYAPQTNGSPTAHRWMGSAAMDGAGDIAVGYSLVDATNNIFPSIAYTGRTPGAPLGSLPEPERTMFSGNSAQTNSARWGDYSAMSVDPVDDCTFWYTQQHSGNRATRIGAFRFNSCGATDLAVTKVCEPQPATAGETITCRIYVDNLGTADAYGVTLTETLNSDEPVLLTSISADPSGACSPAPPTGPATTITETCDLGRILRGGRATVTVTLQTDEGTTIANAASVTSTTPDSNPTNNSSSTQTPVSARADLSVTKSAPSTVDAGTDYTYTITVANAGPSTARNVLLTDILPAGTTVVSVNPGDGSCNAGVPGDPNQPTTCGLGSLAKGGSKTVQVTVHVRPDVPPNTVLFNQSTVSSDTADPDNSDNYASVSTVVHTKADLSLTKTTVGDPVAGTGISYRIKVSNAGPSVARNVSLRDKLPAELEFVSAFKAVGGTALGDPLPCQEVTIGTNEWDCPLGVVDLTGGNPAELLVNVKIKADTPNGTALINEASLLSDTADPTPATASVTVSVKTRADIAILNMSDKDVYKPTSTINYTITVTNNGPSDAQNVVIRDNLPDIRQAVYKFDTGGCVKSANVLICSLGSIPAGHSKSFNVYVTVKGNQGRVTNVALIDSSGTVDPNSGNNTSTRVVLIKGGP